MNIAGEHRLLTFAGSRGFRSGVYRNHLLFGVLYYHNGRLCLVDQFLNV